MIDITLSITVGKISLGNISLSDARKLYDELSVTLERIDHAVDPITKPWKEARKM